jgi:trans-2,3-dihydro-3-hydroxyanthranilate isomerase
VRYLHYDVFTTQPLLGNQLAVFPDARGMDGALMQAVACEMNFSESTFVLPSESAGTDVRMRIFTPQHEMPMAGHPTIGTTFALAHTGAIPPGAGRFVFGLNIGPVPVDLEWDDRGLRFAWMTQSNPTFGEPLSERAEVASALGLPAQELAGDLPVQTVSCGVPFLMVPLRDRGTVDRAVPDGAAARRLGAALGETPQIFLFAVLPAGAAETVYSRMFAPALGIAEDPATGSASGPLGCYLVEHGIVSGDAAQRIVSRQGVKMGRASTIHVAVTGRPGAIERVKVGGQAVLVGRGELMTP